MLATLCLPAACTGQAGSGADAGTADWVTVAPAEAGLDPAPLERLRAAADAGQLQNLHAILVVRDGKLVFEEYYGGFALDTRQYTASVSKSVGSILLGIAMDRGLLPGLEDEILDEPLLDLLPEYGDELTDDPRKREILLRHALSMSGGLEWDEQTYPYSDPRNDWIRASSSDDPVGFALSRPVVAPPGTAFNYNGGYSILVSYLVQRATGRTAEAFAAEYLFGPLGIEDWEWETLASGLTDTDGGLHLRPRDMARLGQLFLNGGVWNGERVVSEAWVAESTGEHMANEGMPDYGLQWWLGDFHYAGRTAHTFLASGHGGQRIHVFPELDLVVVIAQEVFDNPPADLNALAILTRYVLPAADPTAQLPEAVELPPATLARYAGRYAGSGGEISVEYGDGRLTAEAEGAPTIELRLLSETRFVGTVAGLLDVYFEFRVGPTGTVDGVRTTWGFDETEFVRVEPGS